MTFDDTTGSPYTEPADAELTVTLNGFVREALEDCADEQEAANQIRLKIEGYDFFETLISRAIWAAIRAERHHIRGQLWHGVDSSDGLEAMAAAHALTLLDFPLPSGIRLGDADKHDLEEAIQFFTAQARGNARSAKFIKKVQKAMAGEFVKDTMTHIDLLSIQKEVGK